MLNWRKSPLRRKAGQVMGGLSRRLLCARAKPTDYAAAPPILCNSFPKSGTHLLAQILAALPGVTDHRAFWACIPSFRFQERTTAAMLKKISVLVPGELICAHLHHDPDYANHLHDFNVVQYFIYRDPRDVVVSEARYLAEQSRWHRLHRYYQALSDDEQRIALAIMGREKSRDFPYDYPDVAQRFNRFRGWLKHHNVMPVRFEDLVGPQRDQRVREIVQFYLDRLGDAHDPYAAAQRALANIDPEKSYTFRKGQVGAWRKVLTEKHRDLIKEVAGELLIELGYEQNFNW